MTSELGKMYLNMHRDLVAKNRGWVCVNTHGMTPGSANVVFTLVRHRDNSDLVIHLVFGIAWILIGGEKLRLAMRARDQPHHIEP